MTTKRSDKRRDNSAATIPAVLKRSLNGCELHPGSYPSDFTSRPWYPLVVRIENPGAVVLNTQLGEALVTQLFGNDPPSPAALPIVARILTVRFWGNMPVMSGTNALPPVSLTIYDTLASAAGQPTRILQQYTRYSDAVKRAAVGYQYPIAQREVVIPLRNPQVSSALFQMTGTGTTSVVYVSLLWRSGNNHLATYEASAPPEYHEETRYTGWCKRV